MSRDRINPSITRMLPDFQTPPPARQASPRQPVNPTPWLLAIIAVAVVATSAYFITNDRADRAAAEEATSFANLCAVARSNESLTTLRSIARERGCDL